MAYTTKARAIRRLARQGKRCSGNNEKQATRNTSPFAANGFLNHAFAPLVDGTHEELQNYKQVERDFFKSLSHLAKLYGFAMPDVPGLVFPLNVLCSYEYAKDCLKEINPSLQLFVLQEGQTFLATAKTFTTGTSLFYISVQPLIQLWEHKKYCQANLLLSVFTYLHRVAGIPFYTDDYSYLSNQYESIENWLQEDEEADQRDEQLLQLQRIAFFGKRLKRKLSDYCNLKRYARRLNRFNAVSVTDNTLLELSKQFFMLLQQYPAKNIFNSVWEGLTDPHEEERILPEYYISFMYDHRDCLSDTLFTNVSEHLNNCGTIDEPLVFQYFITEQKHEQHDLDFEQRLFDLLGRLIELLNDIKDEEYN